MNAIFTKIKKFFKRKKKRTPKVITYWVGTVKASWIKAKDEPLDDFYFHLYESTNGDRYYELSGKYGFAGKEIFHGMYSLVISPWIDSGDPDFIEQHLLQRNPEYWDIDEEYFVQAAAPKKSKPKHEFKLLKFEKPDDKCDTVSETLAEAKGNVENGTDKAK